MILSWFFRNYQPAQGSSHDTPHCSFRHTLILMVMPYDEISWEQGPIEVQHTLVLNVVLQYNTTVKHIRNEKH